MKDYKYLKMKSLKETFSYDEKNGTVRCEQVWDFFVPREYSQVLIFDGKFDSKWNRILSENNSHIVIKTTGNSKLMDGDKWDAKTGEHIASTKASLKAYHKYYKIAAEIHKKFYRLIGKLKTTMFNAELMEIRTEGHLTELIEETK